MAEWGCKPVLQDGVCALSTVLQDAGQEKQVPFWWCGWLSGAGACADGKSPTSWSQSVSPTTVRIVKAPFSFISLKKCLHAHTGTEDPDTQLLVLAFSSEFLRTWAINFRTTLLVFLHLLTETSATYTIRLTGKLNKKKYVRQILGPSSQGKVPTEERAFSWSAEPGVSGHSCSPLEILLHPWGLPATTILWPGQFRVCKRMKRKVLSAAPQDKQRHLGKGLRSAPPGTKNTSLI